MNHYKTSLKTTAFFFLTASLVTFTNTLFASGSGDPAITGAPAQCVQCGIEGGCFICEAATCCAKKCRTPSCMSCLATDPCGGGALAAASSGQDEKAKFNLKFDEDSIREIAAVAPRFAASLATFNKLGGLTDSYTRFSWANVGLNPQDVEWWLKPEQESAQFFEKLNRKARRANLSNKPLIIYEIKVSEVGRQPVVTLDVLKGSDTDGGLQSLVIHMADMTADAVQPQRQKRSVARWEVR